MTNVVVGLIVDWLRIVTLNNHRDDKGVMIERRCEILEILQFAKNSCSRKNFRLFKKTIIDELKVIILEDIRCIFNYSVEGEKLFSEVEKKVHLSFEDSD